MGEVYGRSVFGEDYLRGFDNATNGRSVADGDMGFDDTPTFGGFNKLYGHFSYVGGVVGWGDFFTYCLASGVAFFA